MEKVLSLEKMKERYQSPEYILVIFDMETQMVAESPNLYIANLPKEQQESKGFVRCICLDKETTMCLSLVEAVPERPLFF